jgi:predicted nucleotidyltransferase
MTVQQLSDHAVAIREIAARHGATNIRVFGSHARGEARPDSDLDLLVRMEKGRTLLDLIAVQQDVEDLLGIDVDVVSEGGLSPYLRDTILGEARPL